MSIKICYFVSEYRDKGKRKTNSTKKQKWNQQDGLRFEAARARGGFGRLK